jgi:hypothetical protein
MTANFCNVVTGPNTGGYGGKKQFRIERRIGKRPGRRTFVDSAMPGGAAIQ